MIAKYYGKNYSLETLRQKTYITREGVSLLGISDAAEKLGFKTKNDERKTMNDEWEMYKKPKVANLIIPLGITAR
jgi:ABC-type bacteriocin/lantibiotic exporter with double-glycine peptidase domain